MMTRCVFAFYEMLFLCNVKDKFTCWLQKVYATKFDKSHYIIGYGVRKIKKKY